MRKRFNLEQTIAIALTLRHGIKFDLPKITDPGHESYAKICL